MTRTILKTLLILFTALLVAECVFIGMKITGEKPEVTIPVDTPTTQPTLEATQPEETEASTQAPTEAPTEAPTTAPAETEPEQTSFLLTFAGDCTLASDPGNYANPGGFIQTIGTDYGYPFRNVLDIFEQDDFTIVNLESVLADSGTAASKLFTFKGPVAYTEILTSSSVEAVTLANNHTADYGQAGYDSTKAALEDADVAYVEEDKTAIYTTESGLVIGLYADSFYFSEADIRSNIQQLQKQGAEIIICAFHWGTEGSYRPTAAQKNMAHAAIDAGADIVYGHHPHVLQPIEEYKDGVIFYSLGNFSFGGNHFPRDMDSAVIQMEVYRDENGKAVLGEMTIIPVSISSISGQNNFQPTPLEAGSTEYDRVLTKLDGSFTGPDLNVDYSNLKATEPEESEPVQTEPPSTEPPQTQAPAPETQAPPPAEENP